MKIKRLTDWLDGGLPDPKNTCDHKTKGQRCGAPVKSYGARCKNHEYSW